MPSPFRLTPDSYSETKIQGDIVTALNTLKQVAGVLRINGGGRWDGDNYYPNYRLYRRGEKPVSKGLTDLIVLLAGGKTVLLEVKKPDKKKPSKDQEKILDWARRNQIQTIVSTSWEDALSRIKRELCGRIVL